MALSIFTISKTKQVYQYGCCCPISYFSGMPRSHPTALSFCHPGDGKQPHHLAITNFISQVPKKTSSQMFLSLPFFPSPIYLFLSQDFLPTVCDTQTSNLFHHVNPFSKCHFQVLCHFFKRNAAQKIITRKIRYHCLFFSAPFTFSFPHLQHHAPKDNVLSHQQFTFYKKDI